MTPALIGRCVENVRIRRIDSDVIHASVFTDGENGFPGLAAIGCLVEAAIAARSPERPCSSDVNDFRIARIDDYAPNVFGLLESEILPAFAAVVGAVDSVSVTHTALRIALARADPHDRRIVRIEGDPSD